MSSFFLFSKFLLSFCLVPYRFLGIVARLRELLLLILEPPLQLRRSSAPACPTTRGNVSFVRKRAPLLAAYFET